ncbi:MAG: xanthine dehydrogenase family protein molybdopterin-binding subunit [Xanthomonadales bacterium]|nr:xanthine dehydrogenase family protein molybdopterin-binding subunit [Xanthomonadales bacterium]
MSTLAKLTRRGFLIGSATIAGGVAFGIYTVKKPHANPLLDGLGEGEVSFNPWIKIGSDGIVLITPHTDLGQGARSVQAALLAEELDLEFGQFRTEPGPPSAAYWNTASGGEGVPFTSHDRSLLAESMRGLVGSVIKVMGLQVTGGSSTVPDSFEKLLIAGASARETLKAAAARKFAVAHADLHTSDGNVLLPDGRQIAYVDLAAEAASIEPVRPKTLREPHRWRLIGKPMPRLDIVAKSTGTQVYGIDLRMEGMVHASLRTNPRQGGPMLRHDSSQAESMPGVSRVLELSNGIAVIADNTWNAIQAARAVEIEWGPAPYHPEMAEHWRELGESFVEARLDKEWRNDGDIAAALGGTGDVLELEYRAPYLAHAPLEPISAVVQVSEQRVDLWVSHQIPRFAQDLVSRMTGLPVEQVHLHNQYCGGSFGHRLEFENIRYATEIAMQLRGTPVKLTFSREEDFAHDFPRQIALCRARGRVRDGKLDALDLQIAAPSVITSQFSRIDMSAPSPDSQLAAGVWNTAYALPHMRVRAYRAPNLAPVSSWRSVGASTGGFFLESAIDEMIVAAGLDPMSERLRLCSEPLTRKVLEAVAELSGWGSKLGPNRGRGLALVESFGVPTAEVVEVTWTDRGIRIDKVYVVAEVGRVVDPVNFDNQVKGAVVWGLGHAMNCEITYADGIAQQTNYHAFEGMRLYQCPEIVVRGLENGDRIRGIGEPPVPPAAPALANAIFAATGMRLREMPFHKFIDFA